MFLHSEDNHRIEWGDTIRNPLLKDKDGTGLLHFDVVTANPPFSLDKWGHEDAANDPYGRFRRGVPPKTKGDYTFISHMIEALKPNTGRMGVVVPHGVLFRGSSEGKIRQQLIEENLLDTVIGLPEKLFFGTAIPAAILIFKKQKTDDNVLFIDASREFKTGKNQNQLTPDNIQKIIDTYKARKTTDKYSYLATPEEIQKNDYNLNIPRYVDIFEEEEEIDLMAARKERMQLQDQLKTLEMEMEGYLKDLGYEGNKRLTGFGGEWREQHLIDIADVIVSPVDKKTIDGELPIELCNYTDVYYNIRITRTLQFMKATAKQSEIDKYTLKTGAVIITKDSETPGDIAVPAFLSENLNGIVCGYHLAIIRPNLGVVDGAYLNYLFSMSKTRYYFFTLATGATRFGLSIGGIKKAYFNFPPIEKQQKIASILTCADKEIDLLKQQLSDLKQEKKALMQQLLTGKRRVQVDEVEVT